MSPPSTTMMQISSGKSTVTKLQNKTKRPWVQLENFRYVSGRRLVLDLAQHPLDFGNLMTGFFGSSSSSKTKGTFVWAMIGRGAGPMGGPKIGTRDESTLGRLKIGFCLVWSMTGGGRRSVEGGSLTVILLNRLYRLKRDMVAGWAPFVSTSAGTLSC